MIQSIVPLKRAIDWREIDTLSMCWIIHSKPETMRKNSAKLILGSAVPGVLHIRIAAIFRFHGLCIYAESLKLCSGHDVEEIVPVNGLNLSIISTRTQAWYQLFLDDLMNHVPFANSNQTIIKRLNRLMLCFGPGNPAFAIGRARIFIFDISPRIQISGIQIVEKIFNWSHWARERIGNVFII